MTVVNVFFFHSCTLLVTHFTQTFHSSHLQMISAERFSLRSISLVSLKERGNMKYAAKKGKKQTSKNITAEQNGTVVVAWPRNLLQIIARLSHTGPQPCPHSTSSTTSRWLNAETWLDDTDTLRLAHWTAGSSHSRIAGTAWQYLNSSIRLRSASLNPPTEQDYRQKQNKAYPGLP